MVLLSLIRGSSPPAAAAAASRSRECSASPVVVAVVRYRLMLVRLESKHAGHRAGAASSEDNHGLHGREGHRGLSLGTEDVGSRHRSVSDVANATGEARHRRSGSHRGRSDVPASNGRAARGCSTAVRALRSAATLASTLVASSASASATSIAAVATAATAVTAAAALAWSAIAAATATMRMMLLRGRTWSGSFRTSLHWCSASG